MNALLTVLLALGALTSSAQAKGRVACYFGSWAVYRQGVGHFDTENIDATLCSHIIYAFAKLSYEGEMQVYDDYNDVGDEWHKGQFTKLQAIKAQHPEVKMMIAVGGWNLGAGNFQATVVDPAKRQRFVNTAVDFCKKYQFEGLDIDWEYQDSVGGTEEQKNGFSALLRELRQRFNQEGMLLSIASQANFALMEADYDFRIVSETCDFINVMAYDLHGSWEKYTGHIAPLHPMAIEQGYDRNLNVEAILKKMKELGADSSKINLGLPLYGRCFTLADPNVNGMYAPATGPCPMGQFVPEAGMLGYDEICQNRWPEQWQPEQEVSYAYQGTQWVGYDSMRSLANKIAYAKSVGVSNFFVWSVETDDFTGTCHGSKFPLLRTINENA